VSDDCRVNRNSDFFRNKLLIGIPEIMYIDDYIQNFAMVFIFFKWNGVIRVLTKTESSYLLNLRKYRWDRKDGKGK